MTTLSNYITAVEGILGRMDRASDLSPKASEDYDGWLRARCERYAVAKTSLAAIGASVGERSPISVRLSGISASSTAGLPGALSNWLTNARKKLAVRS